MIDFFAPAFAGEAPPFALTISANSINPNIPSLANAAGWNGQQKLEVTITAALINALYIQPSWSFPGGLEITISANTLVGGASVEYSDGGTALLVRRAVAIRNLGTIAGAGGAGGRGQSTTVYYNNSNVVALGGSGGRGCGFFGNTLTLVGPNGGDNGSYVEYGGVLFGGASRPWAQGGYGGTGGDWGSVGGRGNSGSIGGSCGAGSGQSSPASDGFAPGRSVSGNSFVTWLATGTRLGPIA